jgi:hypothetical protein
MTGPGPQHEASRPPRNSKVVAQELCRYLPFPDVYTFQFHEGRLSQAETIREGLGNTDMSGIWSLSRVAVSHFACLQARDRLCKPWHSVIAGDASKRREPAFNPLS